MPFLSTYKQPAILNSKSIVNMSVMRGHNQTLARYVVYLSALFLCCTSDKRVSLAASDTVTVLRFNSHFVTLRYSCKISLNQSYNVITVITTSTET